MRRMQFVPKVAVFALAILLVGHSISHAQRPGGGRFGGRGFGGGGSLQLLRSEYVQQELNLTDDQKTKIRELAEGSRRQAPGGRGGRDLSREEREKRIAEFREQQEKLNKQVNEVLTDEQQKRLQGIQLQLAGPQAVVRDDIAKEIGLTDSQREKIQGIVREQAQAARGSFEGLRELPEEERRAKFRELAEKRQAAEKETEAKINEVLTDQQKKKLEELKGEPVDRSKLFQGRQRRRDQ